MYLEYGVDECADELELAQDLLVLGGEQRLLRQLGRRQQLQHREGRPRVLLAAQRRGRVAPSTQLRLEAVEAAGPGNKSRFSNLTHGNILKWLLG